MSEGGKRARKLFYNKGLQSLITPPEGLHPVKISPPPHQVLKIGLLIPLNITPVELFSGITNSLRAIRNPTTGHQHYEKLGFSVAAAPIKLYKFPLSLSFTTALGLPKFSLWETEISQLTKFPHSNGGKKVGLF